MIFKEELTKPYTCSKPEKRSILSLKLSKKRLKYIFDNRAKEDEFYIGDKVLKWDSRREEKGKHRKFDFLWKGPYVIYGY